MTTLFATVIDYDSSAITLFKCIQLSKLAYFTHENAKSKYTKNSKC